MTRLEQLQRLIALDPNDPMTHYGVALELMNLERWDDAIAAFARTLECDAGYSAAYYHKARAEIRAHQHDAARVTLAAGVERAHAAGDAKTEREMRELLETIA